MNTIRIRKISISDIDKLQMIGRQTFYETFSGENSEENMKNYLEIGFALEKLNSEISDADSEIYFAELNSEAIG